MQPFVTVEQLKKSFKTLEAVKGITFNIERGEIFSLLGPNGAGKTTTIAMLSGLLEPSGGNAFIGGYSILKDKLAVKRLIGVVPQDLALYFPLTARQNLLFWGRLYGMQEKTLKQRVEDMLEMVSLSDRADDRVQTYSGGMQRRLNLAIGLLNQPELLFLDEPTVGIDPQSRRRILDMVKELRNQGVTILYTTHYMAEADEISDRVGIIDHGELIALGTQKELIHMIGEQEAIRLHFQEGQSLENSTEIFQNIPGFRNASAIDHQIVLAVDSAEEALPQVVAAASQAGIQVRTIEIEEPNLETVFLHLTGRALRD